MGGGVCFVPGCSTGYKSDRRKKKVQGKKIPSMFQPRSAEQMKQWRKYIPRADRELTMLDCVCELHFLEDDVVKYYETRIADGTTHRLERGRYKLLDDAVPLIYPCLPNYLTEVIEMRKKMKQRLKAESDQKENQKTENFFDSQKDYLCNVEKPSKTVSYDSRLNRNQKTEDAIDTPDNFLLDVDEPSTNFTFSELTENIDCIIRPNILWGITCHELFVMCALWSTEGELQLKIIIDKNMDVKVFLNEEVIVLKKALTCVEDVSALLSKINGDVITDSTSL